MSTPDPLMEPEFVAHRTRHLLKMAAECVEFAFTQRPTVPQAEWEDFVDLTDAYAQVVIEHDPTNRAALAWRAERRARIARLRAKLFKMGRVPDTHLTLITNIGGEN